MLVGAAGDQKGGALAGGDLPQPFGEQGDAIFGVGDEGQVGQAPEDPAEQAAHVQAAQVSHRIEGTDHGHGAEIGPAEGGHALPLADRQDVAGDPAAHLHGWTGHAGEGLAIGGVAIGAEIAHDADAGIARN